jgi:CHC2 zinc finger/Toprim domain
MELHHQAEAAVKIAAVIVRRRLMTALPDWAAGLPLTAKAWSRERYAKPTLQPSSAAPLDTAAPVPKVNGFHSLVEPVAKSIVVSPPSADDHAQVPLAELIGQPFRDGKINCPFHADNTPSLHVYADHFHCFGCGAHGDHADWLMLVEGKTRKEAIHVLENWNGPAAARPANEEDAERALTSALRLWEAARPIAGTLAIRYLAQVRGIDTGALPDEALRFHPRCPFGPGVRVPCLLALYRDVESDAPAGIHRIALTPDVFAGGKVQRRTLGSWSRPRAVKLWPAGSPLVVGEGIETALAAATRISHRGAPLRPAWSMVCSGSLSKLPTVPGVERLLILVDHDRNGEGQAAAARCAERWSRAGRTVVKLLPKRPGSDFNDIVKEKAD